VGEAALGAVLVIYGGEDVTVREEVAQRSKDPFCPSNVEQEVVHEGDAGGRSIHAAAEFMRDGRQLPAVAPARGQSAGQSAE
jgi:hypothetical protein